ncbi:MAG: hypothetical protein ACI8TP_001571 [Acidimicrobiales bacterium]
MIEGLIGLIVDTEPVVRPGSSDMTNQPTIAQRSRSRFSSLLLAVAVALATLPFVAIAPAGASGSADESVDRLYCAYFLRAPDAGGSAYWNDRRSAGLRLDLMAEFFAGSEEFRSTYGDQVSNGDFIRLIYRNLFDRLPDDAGFAFWVDALDGGMPRGRVMIHFSESEEYRDRFGAQGCGTADDGGGEPEIRTDKILVLRARSGQGGGPESNLVRATTWSWNTTTGRLTARAAFGFGAAGESITAWSRLESGFKPYRPNASLSVDTSWNGRVSAFSGVDSHSNVAIVVRLRERDTQRVVWEEVLLNDGVGAGYQGIAAFQIEGSANNTFPLPVLDTSVIYRAEVELRCTTQIGLSLGTTVCDMRPELLVAGSGLDYGLTLNSWSVEYDQGVCPPEVKRDGCVYP